MTNTAATAAPAIEHDPNVAVRADGLSKSFGGILVLKNASVALRKGEIHGLVGENGAGKSTLAKLIGGVHVPSGGHISVGGRVTHIPNPAAAIALGIALIHQEPLTFPDLSVAENIFIHRQPRRYGIVDWASMNAQAAAILTSLGVTINPRQKVRGLSIADQQTVEMAAAISQHAKVLLMDETTAALTPSEVKDLFRVMRQLRDQGAALAFIGHRLEEIFDICDRITILRDGEIVGHKLTRETSIDEVLRLMVGRPMDAMFARQIDHKPGDVALEVRSLCRAGEFEDISFNVRQGEIVALAGLVGAGRTEVARAIFGVAPAESGEVLIAGKSARINGPRDAMRLGLALVPEDRQHHGVLMPLSVWRNATLAIADRLARLGFVRDSSAKSQTADYVERLQVRLRSIGQPIRELSGGNQQKIVLAKWLMTKPRIMILDEPTRGIDIGAKAEVHKLVSSLAAEGIAVLMISSELPEVLAMADRVLVMREGRLTGEFERKDATQEKIMAAATGQGVAAAMDAAHRSPQPSGASLWTRFRELGIAAVVVLAMTIASCLQPRFLSNGLRGVLIDSTLIAIVAMGQMMVIITRNIDLSVGSTLGLTAIVVGKLLLDHPGFSPIEAGLIAVVLGGMLGLFNGLLVALLDVPSIIATLGTYTAYRGLTFIYSGGKQVDSVPRWLTALSQVPAGVPWIVYLAAGVAVATAMWLGYSRTGRDIFAAGSNPPAARLRGIGIRGILMLVFTITGALSGFAGLLYASRIPYVNPEGAGKQMELVVISAVVIGGTNVFGGSGSVLGTVLGCLLLGIINVALPTLGVSDFWQLAVYGLCILVAATTDTFIQRRSGLAAELP